MKIVFLGSSSFAVKSLKALVGSDHEVVGVFTQPDRKVGRKQELKGTPVKGFALDEGLDIFQPEKSSELFDLIKPLEPDFIIVVAYGLILKQEVIDLAKIDTLNVHGSLLPRLRGAAPIHFALMCGDKKAGVCVMRVVKKLDAGPVYSYSEVDIQKEDDFASLHDKLADLGANLLVDTISFILDESIKPQDQNDSLATYCTKITKDMGKVNFIAMSFKEIWNRYRPLNIGQGYFLNMEAKSLNCLSLKRLKLI